MGTVAASVVAQRWWVEAWRHLEGDALRARTLRGLGDALPRSAVWALIEFELPSLGKSTAGRSELSGRIALAVLLDVAHRCAPKELGPLVRVLVRRGIALGDFALVGALSCVVDRLFEGWKQVLSPGARTSTRQELAQICEILPFDASAEGQDQAARRRQGELVLGYRNQNTNLNLVRLGVATAAEWAADEVLRARLARVGGRLEPEALFVDVVADAALAAMRMRRALAARGTAIPPPDLSVMNASAAIMKVALERVDDAATARAPTQLASTTRAVAKVERPEAKASGPSASTNVTPAREEMWWEAARKWARGEPSKLGGLVESAHRLATSRLWPLIDEAVRRLPISHTLRLQETGRYALAVLADEFLRAQHDSYPELLEILLVERQEVIDLDEVGELWTLLDPLFTSWAKLLDPKLDPRETAKVGKTLDRRGDILPWDSSTKGPPAKHDSARIRIIEAVYGGEDKKDPEQARRAAYWGATIARNDMVHGKVRTLVGRVSPMCLLVDVIALAAVAAIRFRVRYAEESKTQPSVPSISSMALAAIGARPVAK